MNFENHYGHNSSLIPGYSYNGITPSLTTGKFGQKQSILAQNTFDYDVSNSPVFANPTLSISNYNKLSRSRSKEHQTDSHKKDEIMA